MVKKSHPMKRPRPILRGLVAGLLAAAASHVQAADVSFDFENQPIGTETPFSMTRQGLEASFAGPADVDPGAFGIGSNFQTATGFQYRLMQGDFLTIGTAFGASGSVLTVTFSAPVTAFAFDFALDDPLNASSLSFATNGGGRSSAAGTVGNGFRYPEGTLSYAGPAFTALTVQSTAIDFQLDSLRVTTVSAVPEPSRFLLLAAGSPLVALLARRRRRRG